MTTSTCFGLKSSWLTFLHYKKNEEKTPVASENEVTKMKSHCQKIWYDTPSSVEVAETLIVITNIASKSHSYWLPCRKKQTSFFRGDMFYPETKIISRLFFFVFWANPHWTDCGHLYTWHAFRQTTFCLGARRVQF